MVEDQLLALSRRVAAAADAWLSDPRDVGAYGRLVDAVSEWRAFVRPPLPGLDVPARVISTVALPASGGAAPLGGPLAEVPPETAADQPARPLAEHLRGDPREVLDRLQTGRNS